MAVAEYTVSGGMVNALRKAGYKGVIFTSAVLNSAFIKLTGENYKGLLYVSNITTLNAYPKAASFVDEYRKHLWRTTYLRFFRWLECRPAPTWEMGRNNGRYLGHNGTFRTLLANAKVPV